jgi:hypothetical protein
MSEDQYQFIEIAEGSIRAAAKVAPLVLQITGPLQSVVDVGGGSGGWLREFSRAGVERVALIDAAVVEPHLLIPRECFHPADLEKQLPELGRFDMACSLECAEHLSESRAEPLVEWLTSAADVVLFSAAIPGQGGHKHINEQFPVYWSDLFGKFNFVRRDVVRQHLLGDASIPWWYRQNLLLYVKEGRQLPNSPPDFLPEEFGLMHREVENNYSRPRLRELMHDLPSAMLNSVRSRLRRTRDRDA